ncbi:MAG: hypothetical protein ACHQRM_06920 [Bacteroidia bacterium]
MKSSDDLFQLIKSLTRNEKGYFKKAAGMHVIGTQNNYVRLFDAIDAQLEYDEQKLIHHFKGETFIQHLPSEKIYLYNLLLKSLKEYHSGISIEAELNGMLHSVEILFDKGLFKACNKLLKKAEKIAIHYEKQLILLRIYDWEAVVYRALPDMEELKKHLDEKGGDIERLISQYQEYIFCKTLDDKIFYTLKTVGFPRNKQDKLIYEKIMKHPLLREDNLPEGFLSQYYYLSAKNMHSEAFGESAMTYEFRKSLVEHVEKFPHLLKDNLILYVRALNNLVNIQDELHYFDEMEQSLQKFNQIQTKSPTIESRIFAYSYALKVARAIESGDFETCVKFLPEIEAGIRKYGSLLHKEFILGFSYNIFYGYFGAGDYRNSLKWMNILLNNDTFITTRPDVYRFAMIMNLILHFELKNHELLSYNIRSTYRSFLKHRKLYRFESLMLDFILRSAKFNTATDLRQGFIALKEEVIKLQEDPFESQVLSFFDIISWLESKISQKSFAEIIRSKAMLRSNQ